MRNKETGEIELLVGNGQIIAGFFILALLLAVFFSMGFIVARAKYQQEPPVTTAAASSPAAEQHPVPAPGAATPTAPEPVPAEPKGEAPAGDATKAPSDVAPADHPAAAPEKSPDPQVIAESMQGTYWQVTSTKDPAAARAMLQSMKDMGLPATLSPGPNDFTRVLVGPYSDNGTMAKVKTQLENAGLHPVKHVQ